MENHRPNLLKFVSFPLPKLPQNSIVNKDGNTIYVEDAHLIRLLSNALQAQYEIFPPPDDAVGTRQPDGNWSGMLGMIVRSEADLAMGGPFITEERHQAMNFTFPIVLSRISFMTDKPQPVSKKLAIFYPFSYEVWITLSLIVIAVALLFYVLINRRISLQRVVLMTFGSVLGQSLDLRMRTGAPRILALSWILGVTVLVYSYKAVLLSFLSFPTLAGIRDIPGLAEAASRKRSFKCFTFKGSSLVGYLMESEDAAWRAIGDCLNRNEVETAQVHAAFHASAPGKAFVGSSNLMASWANDYFISEDSFAIALLGIPFSRKFCCPDRLNAIVHRILASGLLDKITGEQDFLDQLLRKSFEFDTSETTMKIQLDDVSGAFYILMSGWLLSFIALLAEILIAKF